MHQLKKKKKSKLIKSGDIIWQDEYETYPLNSSASESPSRPFDYYIKCGIVCVQGHKSTACVNLIRVWLVVYDLNLSYVHISLLRRMLDRTRDNFISPIPVTYIHLIDYTQIRR